jgi:hypothetical protein
MFFRVISVAREPPPQAAGPAGKQGFEPPYQFLTLAAWLRFFFQLRLKI